MPHSTNQDLRTLSAALVADDLDGLRSLLRNVPPGESARLLTRLDTAEQRQLLGLLCSSCSRCCSVVAVTSTAGEPNRTVIELHAAR